MEKKRALNFSNCKVCDEPLRNVFIVRTTPKMCNICRGETAGGNSQLRQLYLNLRNLKLKPSPDEMVFEDEPNIEVDDQKYYHKSTYQTSFGVSELADIMISGSNHYRYKHGSAKRGYRYTVSNDNPLLN